MKGLIIVMAITMGMCLAIDSFAEGTYQIGMSKQEVIELSGEPVSKNIRGAYEKWEYKLQSDIREVLYFNYGKLIQMTRWATDSTGRKLHEIDVLSITNKKCSLWPIPPSTPSYLIS